MTSISFHLLTPEDERGLELWNCAAPFDPLSRSLFKEKVWEDSDLRPGGARLAEMDGEPAGLVVAVARQAEAGPRGYVKLLAVGPKHRRQGIGSLLLKQAENHLVEQGAAEVRIAESAPNYLTPGVDKRYSGADAFLRQQGYKETGVAVNMSVCLHDNLLIEESLGMAAPEGCLLRRARPDDKPQLLSFLAEHWPAWQAEALAALHSQPPTLFVALRDDRLIGFSAFECNNRGTGWFGPMGVASNARGGGLGRLLLARCLSAMAEMGFSEVTIPWVGPPEFYARAVGAKIHRTFGRYQKLLSS